MTTVVIKAGVREELEAVLPSDRTIDIDERGYVSLCDKEFYITADEIGEAGVLPVVVPESVTPRQFKLALLEVGMFVGAKAYAEASPEFKIYFEDSLDFERNHHMLIGAAEALGVSKEQLDQVFILAGGK